MVNDSIILKIEALIEELNGIKAEYRSKLSAKEKEIDELLIRLQQDATNIEGAAHQADKVNGQVAAQEQRVKDINDALAVLEKLLAKYGAQLDELRPVLDEWKPRLETIEEYAESIEYYISRGEELDEGQAQLAKEHKALKDSVELVRQQLHKLKSECADQHMTSEGECKKLDQRLQELGANIVKLEEYLKDLNRRSAAFKEIISQIERYQKKLEDASPAVEKLIQFKAEIERTQASILDLQSKTQKTEGVLDRVDRTLRDYDKIREDMVDYLLGRVRIDIDGNVGSRTWVLRKK